MTDQEINKAVALKLTKDCICLVPEVHVKDYCHSVGAAWEIVEKIKNTTLFTLWWHDGDWECDLDDNLCSAKADTAPMAIRLTLITMGLV